MDYWCNVVVLKCGPPEHKHWVRRILSSYYKLDHDKWVPVTTAWRVLRLRKKERPPILRVAANILNKQSRTASKGWTSSFGVGQGANNSPP